MSGYIKRGTNSTIFTNFLATQYISEKRQRSCSLEQGALTWVDMVFQCSDEKFCNRGQCSRSLEKVGAFEKKWGHSRKK